MSSPWPETPGTNQLELTANIRPYTFYSLSLVAALIIVVLYASVRRAKTKRVSCSPGTT